MEAVAREIGVGVATLERWRSDALSRPARERAWTAAARFEAVLTTAALDEAARNAWCREHGVYPQGPGPMAAQGRPRKRWQHPKKPVPARCRPSRIGVASRELERELRRKEKALAEAAALLVLSKKLEAIFPKDRDEDA